MNITEDFSRRKAEIVATVLAALPKPVQHRLSEGEDDGLSLADLDELHDEAMAAKHRLADPPAPRKKS